MMTPRLEDIFETIDTSNGTVQVANETYFDMEMRKAYFITVRKLEDMSETATG
jgi:hypothetical protein